MTRARAYVRVSTRCQLLTIVHTHHTATLTVASWGLHESITMQFPRAVMRCGPEWCPYRSSVEPLRQRERLVATGRNLSAHSGDPNRLYRRCSGILGCCRSAGSPDPAIVSAGRMIPML